VLKHIEDFDKYADMTGFKNVKIENVEEFLWTTGKEKPSNVEIQFFDAEVIATWQHLYFAVLNALTAFKNEENFSKSAAMETMLYASAQRQIRKATELVGIKRTSSKMAVLIIGGKTETAKSSLSMISTLTSGQPDDRVLKISKEKAAMIQKAFDVSETELKTVMEEDGLEKALVNLVIERMALLSTQR
jgi:KEOPS complex subunit Cgi121